MSELGIQSHEGILLTNSGISQDVNPSPDYSEASNFVANSKISNPEFFSKDEGILGEALEQNRQELKALWLDDIALPEMKKSRPQFLKDGYGVLYSCIETKFKNHKGKLCIEWKEIIHWQLVEIRQKNNNAGALVSFIYWISPPPTIKDQIYHNVVNKTTRLWELALIDKALQPNDFNKLIDEKGGLSRLYAECRTIGKKPTNQNAFALLIDESITAIESTYNDSFCEAITEAAKPLSNIDDYRSFEVTNNFLATPSQSIAPVTPEHFSSNEIPIASVQLPNGYHTDLGVIIYPRCRLLPTGELQILSINAELKT